MVQIWAFANFVIADVFYRANLIEKWGRGIQKIISSCLATNVPEPEFFADDFEFKVIFRFPTSLKPPVIMVETTNVPEELLTQREQLIINILTKENGLAVKRILSQVYPLVSLRTLNYDLSNLKAKGLIESKGKTNTKKWFLLKG